MSHWTGDSGQATAATMPVRPPIGIMPRKLHDGARQREIVAAMLRYLDAGQSLPVAWVEELNDLCKEYTFA